MPISVASVEIQPLADNHKKSAFSCGVERLDRYIRQQAEQDARRKLAATFVMVSKARPETIMGYYTLSAAAIDPGELSPSVRKKLPHYLTIPATLIGRLARDVQCRGEGIGEYLLIDALRRSYQHSKEIAFFAVVVDAIDDQAHVWYGKKWGFIAMQARDDRLYLPMKTIEKLFIKS
jgi:predicted GNAT family N-acyltransferase